MSAAAHMNGDCWYPTCPYCAAEDAREAADREDGDHEDGDS